VHMETNQVRLKVAISSDFLNAFSRIPRGQQAKVMEFITKFRADPASSAINYEKIQRAKDKNLRSVRIDQSYRGIVLRPETGNVYVLLWVDHHDKAYQWAENKVYTIHPETGGLQVIDVQDAGLPDIDATKSAHKQQDLFSIFNDKDLLLLGVPEPLLKVVRKIYSEEDLDRVEVSLPQEASEALYMLAAGYTLEEVLKEQERPQKSSPVDTSDFSMALSNPDSLRRFFVIADDLELAAILNEPLEKWRVFLHPSQRRFVEKNWNGPVRILGGAGTGKTVVAMHRAKWLAQKVFTGENESVLFVTFTRNLAADIRENLAKICSREVMRRIEITNLDKWVSDFLRKNGYNHRIDYGHQTTALWEKALALMPDNLALDNAFYREEWERVIQPQEINSLEDYVKTSRIGRGVKLGRSDRAKVWPVFEEYRHLLNEHGFKEADDAMRDARILMQGKKTILPYKAILLDEAQDMGNQAFKLIREIVPSEGPNRLFIVGDAHQRIYRRKVVLSRCGIDVRGRSRKLKINYRTTEETRRWAVRVLEGFAIDDLDGGKDDQKGYKSLLHGAPPDVRHFPSFADEVVFLGKHVSALKAQGADLKSICLLARTNDLLKQYQEALRQKGVDTYLIHRNEPENRGFSGVRLATMHRIKGLEFDWIMAAGVNDGIVPLEGVLSTSDLVVLKEWELQERALLYVSVTRAKKEVLVTSFGKPSRFLMLKN
jgi:hypothetical protein